MRMPATDYQGFTITSSIIGRGNAMDANNLPTTSLELELEGFQRQIAERFVQLSAEISSAEVEDVMSLRWVRSLLDAFLRCQEDFHILLSGHRSAAARPPMDRLVADYFDRSVKALDVCNAIRDGIEQIRHWHGLLGIVLAALAGRRPGGLGEGQFRRAKKALVDLAIAMLDEKDSAGTAAAVAYRNRSFGRNTGGSSQGNNRQFGHFRSLSWSVSRSWSAARQLQTIAGNVAAPRANELVATGGLAAAVFAANSVLLFTMWALVAAIPCQDRGGLQVHFSAPRHLPWAAPMMALHDRIVEESKRRERRNACGLLREIHQIERCSRVMSDLSDSVQFPLAEERAAEVGQRVEELSRLCEALREGLDPLERQVRDVFHRIVRSRTEGLDSFGRTNYSD